MNERIRALADQAEKYAEEKSTWRGDNTEWRNEFEGMFKVKFAELIVRECARIARATPAPNFHEHLKQQLGHTWDMACIESGREIVKHFGVEK